MTNLSRFAASFPVIPLFGVVFTCARMIASPATPLDDAIGQRPYEMARANRTEERTPLADFENVDGWRMVVSGGARADFEATREQRMWGERAGKISFAGQSSESRFIIRPPEPIGIPNEFDTVEIWIYGNNWMWEALDPDNPRVNISIHLLDAKNRQVKIPLVNVNWKEWFLVHKKIDRDALADMAMPVSFAGIEVSGCSNAKISALYFDSLSFFKEELKPLDLKLRPKRNIGARPGQNHGLNTGPGVLPFPTRPETILPENIETVYKNSVNETGKHIYEFVYDGADAKIRYVYAPEKGSLGEIEVYVNGRKICHPMGQGGIIFGDRAFDAPMAAGVRIKPNRSAAKLRPKSAELSGDGVLTVNFSAKGGDAQYRMWIWGKTLVAEISAPGGGASELALGRAEEINGAPELIKTPYLTISPHSKNDPAILMIKSADAQPVFVSALLDWYNSNASLLYARPQITEDGASFNGGAEYLPRTDGVRNDMFERIFLTASPLYEETLPTIPNPPSPAGQIAGEYLFQHIGPSNYDSEHRRSRALRSYGIEKLIQRNHEDTWRDGGESYTLRLDSAPGKGGDDALKKYVAAQKSLGWRSGLYTNYIDIAPVNAHFDESAVNRLPNGDWQPAWARCYTMKPSRAVEFEFELAPRIQSKFNSNAAYTDVHTAVAPWERTDYDARVPGAGTFDATFYAYGELLLNDQNIYGPTFSEGIYHWMYAGLVTGSYAQDPGYDLFNGPLNVAFDLLKLHPLGTDVGMGVGPFKMPPDARYPDEAVDRLIAATIAYGHIGYLVEENAGGADPQHAMRLTARSYYMVQQVAKRYAMVPVAKIEYFDEDNNPHTGTEAVANNFYGDSRLHVVYENGLEIYVNWSRDHYWMFPDNVTGHTEGYMKLPPSGWCAFDDKGFFAGYLDVSGPESNRRNVVISDAYTYRDGRNISSEGAIPVGGAVAEFHLENDGFKFINIVCDESISFISKGAPYECTGYDGEHNAIGPAHIKLTTNNSLTIIDCTDGARYYICAKSDK